MLSSHFSRLGKSGKTTTHCRPVTFNSGHADMASSEEVQSAVENLLSVVRRASGVDLNVTASSHTANNSVSPRSTTTPSGSAIMSTTTAAATTTGIANAVERARSMITFSSRRGSFTRLNQRERLRASSSNTSASKKQTQKRTNIEKKPFEVVLVSTPVDYDDEEPGETMLLSEEVIVLRGFLQIYSNASESDIRKSICDVVNQKYPLVSSNDFEFMKANRRKLTKPISCEDYDFKQLKLLVGQGSIYVKMKKHFEYLIDTGRDDDDLPANFTEDEEKSVDDMSMNSNVTISNITEDINTNTTNSPSVAEVITEVNSASGIDPSNIEEFITSSQKENDISEVITIIVNHCTIDEISNPVEVLRIAQKCIVRGRSLEVIQLNGEIKGETNSIFVDRYNLLATAKEEMCDLEDPRVTLEVNFYGESARDLGGPRKEFFRLLFQEINTKYFEHGLREELSEDYEFVGLICALSILQNGPLPKFLPEAILQSIFQEFPDTSSNMCVQKFCTGMNKLGFVMLCKKMNVLNYIFQHNDNTSLTRKKLLSLLEPDFAPEGSNKRKYESEVYAFFVKYVKEAAAGRCGAVTLASILRFVACTDEEPILGFEIKPQISFPPAPHDCTKYGFIPTSHTCGSILKLPVHFFWDVITY